MREQEIYKNFMDWLKQTWYGLPETDELEPLIKATYTPEEASLLTGMPFSGRNLEDLAEIKGMDPAELGRRMDAMGKKGLVFRSIKGDTVRYSLNDAMFVNFRSTYWAGSTDDRTKAIAPWTNQYYYHGGYDQWDLTQAKPLRALPINVTIEDTRGILPFEEVVKVLDQHDYYTVSACPCKHRKNLDPAFDDCNYPLEVCLHFGRLGQYLVENEMARKITREETEEILRKSAQAGLVHGVANMQEKPDTICNCDPCCCVAFEAVHKLKHAQGMVPSNYRVSVKRDTCIGCGLCVKRCPMQALSMEDDPEAKDRVTLVPADNEEGQKELKNKKGQVSVVNSDLCIGCGVCAYTCPSKSLVLVRNETITHPPKDVREWVTQVATDFAAARSQAGERREE